MKSSQAFKAFDDWQSYNYDSIERGQTMQRFVYEGQQWDDIIRESRVMENHEVLVFNSLLKEINTVKSKLRNIELTLDATPFDSLEDLTQQEILLMNVLRSALKGIHLNNESCNAFNKSLEDALDKGQSAILVDLRMTSQDNLNVDIKLEVLNNMSCVFFDKSATGMFLQDGKYCGRMKKLTLKR